MLPELTAVRDCENLCGRTVSSETCLPDQTTADLAYHAAECLPRSAQYAATVFTSSLATYHRSISVFFCFTSVFSEVIPG